MRITLLASNRNISASELLSCTQRFDLTPMPTHVELVVQSTAEMDEQLKEGREILVGDVLAPYELIYVDPVKSQHIKEGRRIGGIPCIAALAGCKRLIEASTKPVIETQTSFNSAIRACGAKTSLGDDLPLPKFICLKGTRPSNRLAMYLQQEAAVMCFRNNKMAAVKIDMLLNQKPMLKLDPSAVQWIESQTLENMHKSSYVSIDSDGVTVLGEDTTLGQQVIQRAGLDARQLKNLEKVLMLRGVMIRPFSPTWRAGDVVEINRKKYVFLTVAHHVATAALGGASAMATKVWLASL
ncbi:hypothetical protein [Alkanindiges illinoisensis]|uniref:hypothetical protein n=1 Tax=Alkanindiges illinoisensis TaxID=197183 RepID=UPI00047C9235|nr:hypothetical protein [Alkanindiges illinoisensis]